MVYVKPDTTGRQDRQVISRLSAYWCQNRDKAAQLALCAFEDWLTRPAMADVLRHARKEVEAQQ
jgi:hypothetical protein